MFDMKMTTLMRLILFLLVYFMLTNLFIATEGEEALTKTTMDLKVPEPEPEEVTPEEPGFWAGIKTSIGNFFMKTLGMETITKHIKGAARYIADLLNTLFRLISFDIPFPEFMADTVLVNSIRITVGTTVTTILIIIILQLITLIKNMISPFAG